MLNLYLYTYWPGIPRFSISYKLHYISLFAQVQSGCTSVDVSELVVYSYKLQHFYYWSRQQQEQHAGTTCMRP